MYIKIHWAHSSIFILSLDLDFAVYGRTSCVFVLVPLGRNQSWKCTKFRIKIWSCILPCTYLLVQLIYISIFRAVGLSNTVRCYLEIHDPILNQLQLHLLLYTYTSTGAIHAYMKCNCVHKQTDTHTAIVVWTVCRRPTMQRFSFWNNVCKGQTDISRNLNRLSARGQILFRTKIPIAASLVL